MGRINLFIRPTYMFSLCYIYSPPLFPDLFELDLLEDFGVLLLLELFVELLVEDDRVEDRFVLFDRFERLELFLEELRLFDIELLLLFVVFLLLTP